MTTPLAPLVVASSLLLANAAYALPRPPERSLSFLHVGAPSGPSALRQIVDAKGRTILLKGMNVTGLTDYQRSDPKRPLDLSYPRDAGSYRGGGCPPLDPAVVAVPLCEFDFAQMRPLGYNVIRLALSWSLLEPTPGQIDEVYVERIAQVVDWARQQGIYVLLDMHQDAWSKYILSGPGDPCVSPFEPTRALDGYDGAPPWASTSAQPMCALNGQRELDPAVTENFQNLWSDGAGPDGVGLQEHFARVVATLARRFAGDPAVAGYEILNEPSPGYLAAPALFETAELFPFYAKVVSTVRAAVPGFRQLFFIEPSILRDVTDQSAIVTPWSEFSPYPNVVYAPHIYTGVTSVDALLGAPGLLPMDEGYRSAILDAKALDVPLIIGEFGGETSNIDAHYRLQDELGVGGTYYPWKDQNPPNGMFGPPFGAGTPIADRMALATRAYPLALAGALTSFAYNPLDATFKLRATSSRVADGDREHATIVFLPAASAGTTLSADGASMEIVERDSRSREAYVYPDGGPYRVISNAGASTGELPALTPGRARRRPSVRPTATARLSAARSLTVVTRVRRGASRLRSVRLVLPPGLRADAAARLRVTRIPAAARVTITVRRRHLRTSRSGLSRNAKVTIVATNQAGRLYKVTVRLRDAAHR